MEEYNLVRKAKTSDSWSSHVIHQLCLHLLLSPRHIDNRWTTEQGLPCSTWSRERADQRTTISCLPHGTPTAKRAFCQACYAIPSAYENLKQLPWKEAFTRQVYLYRSSSYTPGLQVIVPIRIRAVVRIAVATLCSFLLIGALIPRDLSSAEDPVPTCFDQGALSVRDYAAEPSHVMS